MSATQTNNRYEAVHVSPNGPGDARPTAYQILKDNDLIGNLKDRTILVTGGTDGLGKESVIQLAKTGANVYFSARNATKAQGVIAEIKEAAATDADLKHAKVDFITINNSSLESVRKGAQEFLSKSKQLNVLLANAGIAMTSFGRTKDGFEQQFGVNHLAHFALFDALKPLLLKSSTQAFQSRVVTVSSSAHKMGTVQVGKYNFHEQDQPNAVVPEQALAYNPMLSYGQSKTANIWFTNEIERRYGSKGLHGIAIHPGVIFTAGFANFDPAVLESFKPLLETEAMLKRQKSVHQGAATQVLAAVGKDFEGKGRLFLEDAGVSSPTTDDDAGAGGYKDYIFDDAGAKQLWEDSAKFVGVSADN